MKAILAPQGEGHHLVMILADLWAERASAVNGADNEETLEAGIRAVCWQH